MMLESWFNATMTGCGRLLETRRECSVVSFASTSLFELAESGDTSGEERAND